jgi:hypothetical protein
LYFADLSFCLEHREHMRPTGQRYDIIACVSKAKRYEEDANIPHRKIVLSISCVFLCVAFLCSCEESGLSNGKAKDIKGNNVMIYDHSMSY